MSRRWLVTGSRDGRQDVERELDRMARLDGMPTELVCGEARGVDQQAQRWGLANGVPVKVFVAEWRKHGRKAGPLRNQRMVDYCEGWLALCLAFPGPKSVGTHDCYERAVLNGLQGEMYPAPEET